MWRKIKYQGSGDVDDIEMPIETLKALLEMHEACWSPDDGGVDGCTLWEDLSDLVDEREAEAQQYMGS